MVEVNVHVLSESGRIIVPVRLCTSHRLQHTIGAEKDGLHSERGREIKDQIIE